MPSVLAPASNAQNPAELALLMKEESKLSEEIIQTVLGILEQQCEPSVKWMQLVKSVLTPQQPFVLHHALFNYVYEGLELKPAWVPHEDIIATSNIKQVMNELNFSTYEEFYSWSVGTETRSLYWAKMIERLNIIFETKPKSTFDVSSGIPHATYLPGAKLNIINTLFSKRPMEDTAIIYASESNPADISYITFGELDKLSNRVAHALTNKLNFKVGDTIGICMPMTYECVAVYIGIVKAGMTTVSIADSFSAVEIETRLRLASAKGCFTQDVIYRGSKFLPLFERVLEANPLMTVILPGILHDGANTYHNSINDKIRGEDIDMKWDDFLVGSVDFFENVIVDVMFPSNILFSSGTTGEPKAIVWSHSTPMKAAIDGHAHQNIQSSDVVSWPTSLGWMMGPWLLYQLLNGASIALFNGISSTKPFCKFVEQAGVTVLGVIPSLVKHWCSNDTVNGCNWDKIKCFSSTGEASDSVSMLWLMSRVQGYAPIIEYMGGTEIGGSYLTSSIIQNNIPSMFSTPVLGSDLIILDANNNKIETSGSGEVALIPPALGLSTRLLNRDHFECYFDDMPPGPNGEILRKHGDEIQKVYDTSKPITSITLPYYRALGRCDDTMNLGGIKTSSIEIERVCNLVERVMETAAIGVSPIGGGPSLLVVFTVLKPVLPTPPGEAPVEVEVTPATLKSKFQINIKNLLNPLFLVNDVVIVPSLPRTASNKVMRRVLRDEYVSTR